MVVITCSKEKEGLRKGWSKCTLNDGYLGAGEYGTILILGWLWLTDDMSILYIMFYTKKTRRRDQNLLLKNIRSHVSVRLLNC